MTDASHPAGQRRRPGLHALALLGGALAAVNRLLHPRQPDPDYLVEVQRDPYIDELTVRYSIDCE